MLGRADVEDIDGANDVEDMVFEKVRKDPVEVEGRSVGGYSLRRTSSLSTMLLSISLNSCKYSSLLLKTLSRGSLHDVLSLYGAVMLTGL